MPRIIDYPDAADAMRKGGFVSLYHNSGAWGFPDAQSSHTVAWAGPPDDTIRPAARPLVRHVPPPFERNLAELAAVAWVEFFPGPVWLMPRSHWTYELVFGSHEWMPSALAAAGIDPAALTSRNDGSPLEFHPPERGIFVTLLEALLARLLGSDFALAFPGRPVLCTVHHHKQLWWTTTDPTVLQSLDRLVGPPQESGPAAPPPA